MRVNGPGRVGSTQKSGGKKSASKAGESFSVPEDKPEIATTSNVASGSPISSIEALMALQGVGDAMGSDAQSLARGKDLLDRLDDIRHGLLIGAIPVDRLKRLQATLSAYDVGNSDPRLKEIIDEIEVRAAVELAKLGY